MSKRPKRSAAIGTAMRTGEVSIPYVLKRNIFYPLMRGLKEHIIEDGEVTIIGFGKFKIFPRKVKKNVLGKEFHRSYAVKFKPSSAFKREVVRRWTEKTRLVIGDLPQAPVSSVDGEGSGASSAPNVAAPAATSTTVGTDW